MSPCYACFERAVRLVVFALGACIGLTLQSDPALAAEFVVNSRFDLDDNDLTDGRCQTVMGDCTLRAAIEQANHAPDHDLITFLSFEKEKPIELGHWLPNVTQPVTIDGWGPNTQPPAEFAASPVRVELVVSLPLASCSIVHNDETPGRGLVVRASGSIVRGLGFARFPCGGVAVVNASDVSVLDSFIGLDALGASIPPQDPGIPGILEDGVLLVAAPGANVRGNVIAGHRNAEVTIFGGDLPSYQSTFNVHILDNRIGTDRTGKVALRAADGFRGGIAIWSSAHTRVEDTRIENNLISGNDTGIWLSSGSRHTHIDRNRVGTNASGDGAVPNRFGIVVEESERNHILGNVVAAEHTGIWLQGNQTTNTKIEGNRVEATLGGAATSRFGVVVVAGAHDNTIGYGNNDPIPTPLDCRVAATKCNVITGARQAGVFVAGENQLVDSSGTFLPAAKTGNTIRGNRIALNGGLGIDTGVAGIGSVSSGQFGRHLAQGEWAAPPIAVTAQLRRNPMNGEWIAPAVSGLLLGRATGGQPKIDVYRVAPTDLSAGQVIRVGSTLRPDWSWQVPEPGTPLAGSRPPRRAGETYAQGDSYIGTVTEFTGDGRFRLILPLAPSVTEPGQYVMTVTTPDGSTSELSAVCMADTDKDGLCDEWESHGMDVDGDGIVDQELPSADPLVKDIYIEIDTMDFPFYEHWKRPQEGAFIPARPGFAEHYSGLLGVRKAFEANGITLHTDHDPDPHETVPFFKSVQFDPETPPGDETLTHIKDGEPKIPCDGYFGTQADRHPSGDPTRCAARLAARAAVYRYALFADTMSIANPGVSEIGGANLIIALGNGSSDELRMAGGQNLCAVAEDPQRAAKCTPEVQAGTFMHELGHSLGLDHRGGDADDAADNYRPNHLSVMNYNFAWRDNFPNRPLDYLHWDMKPLDESYLDETKGIELPDYVSPTDFTRVWPSEVGFVYTVYTGVLRIGSRIKCEYVLGKLPEQPVDWDENRSFSTAVRSVGLWLPRDPPDASFGQGFCPDVGAVKHAPKAEWPRLDFVFRDWSIKDDDEGGAGENAEAREAARGMPYALDVEGDGIPNAFDNCPTMPNPDQTQQPCGAPAHGSDLVVSTSLVPVPPRRGELATFTVTVRNLGPDPATDAVINVLNRGITINSVTPDTGIYDPALATWAIPLIEVGQEVRLVIVGTPESSWSIGGRIGSTTSAQGAGTRGNSTISLITLENATFLCADDTSQDAYFGSPCILLSDIPTPDPGGDIWLNLSGNRERGVRSGRILSVTTELRALRTPLATGVRVRVPVPPGTHFLSVRPTRGIFNSKSGEWDVGSLSEHASILLTVVADSPGPVTFEASLLSGTPNGVGSNDRGQVTVSPGSAPPVADDIADAIPISGPDGAVDATTVEGTAEPFEPYDVASVWFVWTAPTSGMVQVRTRIPDASFGQYPALQLYEGPTAQMRPLAHGLIDEGRFRVIAGRTYYIAASVYPNSPAWQPFTLLWTLYPSPSNDDLHAAVPLTGSSGSVEGSTLGSFREPGEPRLPGRRPGGSVWYEWTAPYTEVVNLRAEGPSGFKSAQALWVFRPDANRSNLQLVADGGQGWIEPTSNGPQPASLVFSAVAAATYLIETVVEDSPPKSPRPSLDLDAMSTFTLHWAYANDSDQDGIPDNCQAKHNPGQVDTNLDGIGDTCEPPIGLAIVAESPFIDGETGTFAVTLSVPPSGPVLPAGTPIKVVYRGAMGTSFQSSLNPSVVDGGTAWTCSENVESIICVTTSDTAPGITVDSLRITFDVSTPFLDANTCIGVPQCAQVRATDPVSNLPVIGQAIVENNQTF